MQVRMRGNHPAGRGILYFVFGVFLLVGIAVSIPLTFLPWKQHLDAANWERVPCRVISAEVRSHRGDKGGTTYSVDVEFAYERDGREYRSTRASFFSGSTSGRESKETQARAILADPSPTCLVNPADPDDAVFDRSLGPLAFLSLLPLLFALIGGTGLFFTIRASRASPASARAAHPASRAPRPPSGGRPADRASDGFFDLSSATRPLPLFLLLLFFTIAWNGILAVALTSLFTGAFDDATPFVGLFMIPFVLAGVGLLGFTLHTFLSIFNPNLRLAISRDRLVPGEEFSLRWSIDRPERVRTLTIVLEKRETISSWDTDNNHHTKTRVLVSTPVVDSSQPREFSRGERRAEIPADGEPVSAASDRKVAWYLKVSGEIPRWPDLSHDFELPVAAETKGGGVA